MAGLVGRMIGVACAALGLFLLWASPMSTIACSRDGSAVTCRVDRAMLGVLPLEGIRISGVERADVDRSNDNNYQLAFRTNRGRVAPRGADASSGDLLRPIAQQVNDLVAGQGDSFSERSFNQFPNVAGAIFLGVGLLMALFAA
jgi:hypothetical protein